MKAPAPMTGGMSCPPVLAAASTAAAKRGRNPARRINGIVKVPVVTTFATALPLREPISALDTAAVMAGPPRLLPATRFARAIRRAPPPAASRTAPKRMKRKTKSALTPRGMPQTPSVDRKRCSASRSGP